MALPHYYSSLRPFQSVFRQGAPILTYHHVGPRPRGVRIKGLYVTPKLFSRQLGELASAGFTAAPLSALELAAGNPASRYFITLDDGFRDVFDHGLPLLGHHRARAIVYLVSDLLGKTNEWQQRAGDVPMPLMDEHQVRDWLSAGQEIGSHTQTHPRLTELPASKARQEIIASKKSLEDRFGLRIEHFCYPYGDWNDTVRDLVQAAGYTTACTTNSGLNIQGSLFELNRFTARYPSRNLKAIWAKLWPRHV